MAVCTGRGPDGQHCCQIAGGDCQFLTYVDGIPRCGLHDQWGRLDQLPEWQASPVGQHFAVTYPGYDCMDYPQHIPEVMGSPTSGLCCFESERVS